MKKLVILLAGIVGALGLSSTASATALDIGTSAVCDSGGYTLTITAGAVGTLKAYGDINGQASETDYGRITAGVPIPVTLKRGPGTYTGGVNAYFDNGKVSSAQYSVTVTVNCLTTTTTTAATTTTTIAPTTTTVAPTTTTTHGDSTTSTATTAASTTVATTTPVCRPGELPCTGAGGWLQTHWYILVLVIMAGIGLVLLGRRSPTLS